MIKQCILCEVDFESNDTARKFCSKACSNRETKTKSIDLDVLIALKDLGLTDAQCAERLSINVNLIASYIQQLVQEGRLSNRVKRVWNKGRSTKIALTCKQCSKQFVQYPTAKFCSKICHNQFRSTQGVKRCLHCGNEFVGKPKRMFCGYSCSCKHRQSQMQEASRVAYGSDRRSLVLTDKWRRDKDSMLQKRNTEDYRVKIGTTTSQRFRDDAAFKARHAQAIRDSMTEERRSALSAAALKRVINDQCITRPNLIVADLLKRLGIPYKLEQPIGNICRVDILLEDNVAIEIFGDYWHANPMIYTTDVSLTLDQQKNLERDRCKQLALKAQFPALNVLRLWESDVYFNLHKCEQIIRNASSHNVYHPITIAQYEIKDIELWAAKAFCARYHYLKSSFPVVTKFHYGLYAQESLIGVGVFGNPSNRHATNVIQGLAFELSRFCLVSGLPKNSASYFLGYIMRRVKQDCVEIAGLISYADASLHLGTIYKATNWDSIGEVKGTYWYENSAGQAISRQKIFSHCQAMGIAETVYVERLALKRIDGSMKHKFIYRF